MTKLWSVCLACALVLPACGDDDDRMMDEPAVPATNDPTPMDEPTPMDDPKPIDEPNPMDEPTPMDDPKPMDEPTPMDDPKPIDEPTTPVRDAMGDAQTPPSTKGADVEAWLTAGSYKAWSCEDVAHPQMKVSPHGHNRVCSNGLVAAFDGAPGDERPSGSASVKEIYDDANQLIGYAVAIKLASNSNGGKNWYWYERIGERITADGLGTPVCVSCHSAAGSDDTHAVTTSYDFVYLQVAQ